MNDIKKDKITDIESVPHITSPRPTGPPSTPPYVPQLLPPRPPTGYAQPNLFIKGWRVISKRFRNIYTLQFFLYIIVATLFAFVVGSVINLDVTLEAHTGLSPTLLVCDINIDSNLAGYNSRNPLESCTSTTSTGRNIREGNLIHKNPLKDYHETVDLYSMAMYISLCGMVLGGLCFLCVIYGNEIYNECLRYIFGIILTIGVVSPIIYIASTAFLAADISDKDVTNYVYDTESVCNAIEFGMVYINSNNDRISGYKGYTNMTKSVCMDSYNPPSQLPRLLVQISVFGPIAFVILMIVVVQIAFAVTRNNDN